jgi:hypothetical protein
MAPERLWGGAILLVVSAALVFFAVYVLTRKP